MKQVINIQRKRNLNFKNQTLDSTLKKKTIKILTIFKNWTLDKMDDDQIIDVAVARLGCSFFFYFENFGL